MNKKELRSMPALLATEELVEKAAAEEIVKDGNREYYPTCAFMQCLQQGDVLKVAFYYTRSLKAHDIVPAYELYLDRAEKNDLIYVCADKKWRTGRVSLLDWPDASIASWFWAHTFPTVGASPEDARLLQAFLGKEGQDIFGLIQEFQAQNRDAALEKRYRMETEPWDAEMELIPPLPGDWMNWVKNSVLNDHYLFYYGYKKTGYHGRCSYCGQTRHYIALQHNSFVKCESCGRVLQCKAVKRAGTIRSGKKVFYLLQPYQNGCILRVFEGEKILRRGKYHSPEYYCFEYGRFIFDQEGKSLSNYSYGLYKQKTKRWIPCYKDYLSYLGLGQVYPGTLDLLNQSVLKKTGLIEYIQNNPFSEPGAYLCRWGKIPVLEKISKAGLRHLTEDVTRRRSYLWDGTDIFDCEATDLVHVLRLNRKLFNKLRDADGGLAYLLWLQYERNQGKEIPEDVLEWLLGNGIQPKEITFVEKQMSVGQIKNYLLRQSEQYDIQPLACLRMWQDYMRMALDIGHDLNDAIVYRPRELKVRHDMLVEYVNRHSEKIRLEKFQRKFPHVENNLQKVKPLYEYQDEKYALLVPKNIEEIIREGRALHHCVGTQDTYVKEIEDERGYILFLRKVGEVDTPWYTVEVTPEGDVKQKHTAYNRQCVQLLPDIEAFLDKWKTVIERRKTAA